MAEQTITVRLNTTYSFGLDDQEFVVAFETDSVSACLIRKTWRPRQQRGESPVHTKHRGVPH
ncbi:MAG TPA: chlorite dismutase family protein [Ktedonobacteraceae bacterium]